MLFVNVGNGLKRVKGGLCDYVADSMLSSLSGDTYPVKVGFAEYFIDKDDTERIEDIGNNNDYVIHTDEDGIAVVVPEFIFVNSGWTTRGDRVEAETIELQHTRNFKLEIPDELEIIV